MKTFVILPARMKSSRLPNKLIKKIGEMTLIEHMIARAKKIKDAIIIVSTDSNIIYDYALNIVLRLYYPKKYLRTELRDVILQLKLTEQNPLI